MPPLPTAGVLEVQGVVFIEVPAQADLSAHAGPQSVLASDERVPAIGRYDFAGRDIEVLILPVVTEPAEEGEVAPDWLASEPELVLRLSVGSDVAHLLGEILEEVGSAFLVVEVRGVEVFLHVEGTDDPGAVVGLGKRRQTPLAPEIEFLAGLPGAVADFADQQEFGIPIAVLPTD